MSKLRFYIALIIARITYLGIKILNRSSGTSLVGMITLKICPNFLAYCKPFIKDKSVTITGTNGKTTTSGVLAHILECNNNSIIHNIKGANMLTGIANVFALNILPLLKKFDYAVIESDEAYLTKLYDYYSADTLIVTNLFRDQLDRYGELSTTAGFIKNAIEKSCANLILNADDPLVTNLGQNNTNKKIFYGFEDIKICSETHQNTSNAPTEAFNCICGEQLHYAKRFFAHEGHYHCPYCNYKRPEPDYKGYLELYEDYSLLKIIHSGTEYEFNVKLVGLYNAYNALAAITCAIEFGIDTNTIKTAMNSYHSIFGRTERKLIKGHSTLIQLIKNPTGASEVLKTVDLNSNIIIAINDNYADGRDISWLWDSDFEQLKNAAKLIVTSGTRANDMALRLKYAGIPTERIQIEPDIKKAINIVANQDNDEKITILPSYTALLKINKLKF